MTEAYIYDALRTPRGKGRKDGSLHEVTSLRLSAQTLNAIKERNGFDGHAVEDVIWGNVTQVIEQGGCLAGQNTCPLRCLDLPLSPLRQNPWQHGPSFRRPRRYRHLPLLRALGWRPD